MSKKNLLTILCGLFSFSIPAFAQSNELSLSVGGVFTTSQKATSVFPTACPVTFPGCNTFTTASSSSSGVAFMGNYTRRIAAFGPATFYVEAPVIGGPGRDTTFTFRNGTLLGNVETFSALSLFFTPSAKVQFLESSRVSPFATVGGGLAHLGLAGGNRNTGALQYGLGVDFRTPIRHLGFRVEARDFVSTGNLRSGGFTEVFPSHEHVVFAGGGPVWRF
jgi:hypothetical protein